MKFLLLLGGSFLILCQLGAAQAPKVLIDETFSGDALPEPWKSHGGGGAFEIYDGALRGAAGETDSRVIAVPIRGRNFAVTFSVKFSRPGHFLLVVDGESEFGGDAHLLRFALTPKIAHLAQDRGSLESKRAQAKEREAGQQPSTSGKQADDSKTYRTESLEIRPWNLTDGEWHQVSIELRGKKVVLKIDALPPIETEAAALDVAKSRLAFHAAQSAEVLIDNVRVLELD